MQPLVLLILDGFGLSPTLDGNAVYGTPTPNFDALLSQYPFASLHASGEEVGLPWGEMGNSEVGHLNLGTGRVIMQDLARINKTISDGTFFTNPELLKTFEYVAQENSALHLIGLFSSGGVHSHLNHLLALLDLAKKQNCQNVFIHLISDGRDTPPKIILEDLPKLQAKIKELNLGQIASVMGRYWAMDRDERWERTKKALKVLIDPTRPTAPSVEEAVNEAYQNNKTDEFIEPVAIKDTPRIKPQDAVIFLNFRADRSKQLSEKIIEQGVYFVSFTSYGYEPTPRVNIAFFIDKVSDQLAMVLSKAKLSQLHMAETEKYPHVTYFFNGGWEHAFYEEERIMVPSPKVATYDLKPEMSVEELTTKFTQYFTQKKPVFTVINFANPDMVGHTGNFEATRQAVAAVDQNLGKLAQTVLSAGADLIVTADHGNAEQMINPTTNEPDKEHTTNPVPLILAFQEKKRQGLPVAPETKIALAAQPSIGVLADVTATIINRLALNLPPEISGQSLLEVI